MPRPSSSRTRAKRADAERNRARILTAARAAFADPEAQISMAEISRRAGVGMATLYRNFPGRRELLEALYTDEVDAVCGAAKAIEARTNLTAGAALMAWLQRFFVFFTSKHQVGVELLKHSDGSIPVIGESRNRVLAAGEPLLAAAQRTFEVRHDLTLEQILDLIIAIASIHGESEYLEPILQTALDGLCLRPASSAGEMGARSREPSVSRASPSKAAPRR
jgi:AcrR family transcriptional regulator